MLHAHSITIPIPELAVVPLFALIVKAASSGCWSALLDAEAAAQRRCERHALCDATACMADAAGTCPAAQQVRVHLHRISP